MSSNISFRSGYVYWINGAYFNCFLDDVARDLVHDENSVCQLAKCRGSQWLELSGIPELPSRRILESMKRTAEGLLQERLPGWLRVMPEDLQGQKEYLVVVQQLLYHVKQDLGLAAPLPPQLGPAALVRVSLSLGYSRTLPYWVVEGLLGAAIAVCADADSDVRERLKGAVTNGNLVVPCAIELPSLVIDRRTLCVVKTTAEGILRGEVPEWLRGPENAEGLRVYVGYVSEILDAVNQAIRETDAFIAEL